MKKVFSIFICLLLFISFNVKACPHADSSGKAHFQFYNEDYTVMSMVYPEVNYLYNKDVPMDGTGVINMDHEFDILNESFGFTILQDKETYWSNYWFTNDDLLKDDWKNLDLKLNIEGISSLLVKGYGYNLNVSLNSTYEKGISYIDDKSFGMNYVLDIDNLSTDEEISSFESIITDNSLELVSPFIMDIDAKYRIVDNEEYNYEAREIVINDFYDNVEVQLYSDNKQDDVVVINLEDGINNYIDCNYNDSDKYYSFNINKNGVYIIIKKPVQAIEEIIEEDEVIEEETEITEVVNTNDEIIEEKNIIEDNIDLIKKVGLILSGVISLIIIIVIIVKIVNRNKYDVDF